MWPYRSWKKKRNDREIKRSEYVRSGRWMWNELQFFIKNASVKVFVIGSELSIAKRIDIRRTKVRILPRARPCHCQYTRQSSVKSTPRVTSLCQMVWALWDLWIVLEIQFRQNSRGIESTRASICWVADWMVFSSASSWLVRFFNRNRRFWMNVLYPDESIRKGGECWWFTFRVK